MMCLSIHFARDRFVQIKWHKRTHVAVMIVHQLLWDITRKRLKEKIKRSQDMIIIIIYLASVRKKYCILV